VVERVGTGSHDTGYGTCIEVFGKVFGWNLLFKNEAGGGGSPACGGCICALARGVGPPPDPVEFIYIHFSPLISFPPFSPPIFT